MKKVLDFLEQHVQWVAIVAGAAYLIFMAWTFVIKAPVSVTINEETLSPGDIDKQIYDKPVQTLSNQMSRPVQLEQMKLTWAEDFKNAMDLSQSKPIELASKPWVDAMVIPGSPGTGGAIVDAGNQDPIAQLPTVPPAIMGPLAAGASNVATPAAPGGVDKNWAVATFKISNKDLASAFAAIKLPKIYYTSTVVLDVTLMREELQSDGSFGDPKTIAHLPTAKLLPVPSKDAKIDEKKDFLKWAAPNQKEILQPGFYQWLKGDPIDIPKAGAPVVEAPTAAPQAGLPDFDPTRTEYTIDEIKQMTPEQRKQWQKALKEKEEKERKDRAGKRGGSGPGGGKGKGGGAVGGGGGRVIDDLDRPDIELPDDVIDPFNPPSNLDRLIPKYYRQDRGGRDPGGMPIPPPPGGRDRGGAMPPAVPPQEQPADGQAPPPVPSDHPYPPGFFDPSEPPEFWEGWAFDETVQAGKTYRYRIVYTIKSPLFNAPSAVKEKEMADVLAIASTPSEWSEPVKIASRTSFYISANFAPEANTVKFQVFAWQDGAKREKTLEVAPGDMIGGVNDGVNFMTGSTLVDIGRDVRTEKSYALIMDSTGTLSRRDFASDKANPEWEKDKNAVAMGAAPPAAPVAENR